MPFSLFETEPWLFPVFFIGMWFVVTISLALKSRWYALMRAFPDHDEKALLLLTGQSGNMGGVAMNRVLTISVCPSGVRVGILRIFGPFNRDFFVPWEHLSINRNRGLFGETATLQFGSSRIGWLRLAPRVADDLARSAIGRWPEAGEFPPELQSEVLSSVFREWVLGTLAASIFFIVAPRIVSPGTDGVPVEVAILFPATVFGIAAVFRYFARVKHAARS